jgi:hypothetical protein
MADSLKVGRNNSCTTKENKEGVSVKLSHCILKNASITFTVFSKRLVIENWQQLITRPAPHKSYKLKEGGETRLPITGIKPSTAVPMSTACNEGTWKASWTSWSQSTASRPAVPARLCKASNSNLKLSSNRCHKIARASRSSMGGGGGVAGFVVFRLRSSIADPSRRQAFL